MLVTNSHFWFSIPHETRTELESIIDEVTFEVNRAAEQQNQADRERLLAGGKAQLTSLDAATRDAWREAMRPVWQQFEEQIGKDVIGAAERAIRRNRCGFSRRSASPGGSRPGSAPACRPARATAA